MFFKLKNDFHLEDEMVTHYYLLPYQVTNEVKLREFQYKILNFLVNTNLLLMKKRIISTDTCDFCHSSSETMYHLFYLCNKVISFWWEVQKYWKLKTNQDWTPGLKEIVLGDLNAPEILNFIIILAKYFIYKCKLEHSKPLFTRFHIMLKDKYQLEKCSFQQEISNSFRCRWSFEPWEKKRQLIDS